MLLGIQDEAYRYGRYYKNALRRLNVKLRRIKLSYRSSLAVIGYVGRRKPYWIKYMSRPQKRGPSYASARIPLGRGEGITSLVDIVLIAKRARAENRLHYIWTPRDSDNLSVL